MFTYSEWISVNPLRLRMKDFQIWIKSFRQVFFLCWYDELNDDDGDDNYKKCFELDILFCLLD